MAFTETVIVAEERGFMTVRHLVMRGPNFEIGKKLAEIAGTRHGFDRQSAISIDPLITRARRDYFALNYPIHLERARGAAYALGVDQADDRHDTTSLPYNQDLPAGSGPVGCSVICYHPQSTATGHGLLSRNYDFVKGSLADIMGIAVGPAEKETIRPLMADPYVIEMYPEDGGYASLCLTSFDLLSGVLDGINSEGLIVSVNGDEIAMAQRGEPNERGVGLNELQGMRLLLDTCATSEEAKEALLANKHFYALMPCHYVVTDRHGEAFVYEHSCWGNNEYFIEATDKPLIVTNHPLHLYPSIAEFPDKTAPLEAGTTSFERYMKLVDILGDRETPYTFDMLKEINGSVAVSQVVSWIPENQRKQFAGSSALSRTLWHCIYDSHARSLDVKFYVGEDPGENGGFTERYTEYFWFTLSG